MNQNIYPVQFEPPEGSKPEAFITTVGVFQSQGDFFWEQVSPAICFHVIHSGTGIFEEEHKEYRVSGGEILIFWPNQHIRYYDFSETPWNYTWITVKADEKSWIFGEAGVSREHPHIKVSDIPGFSECVDKIVSTFRNGEYSPLFPCYSILEMLELIGRKKKSFTLLKSSDLGESVRRMIDSQNMLIPTVDELADHFDLNRTTLFRAFKKRYNISIKEYIENVRFEKACRLLSYSGTSIKEVAYACGFNDQQYFSRTFRKRFGVCPSMWIKT